MWKNMEQPDRAQMKIQYGCMMTKAEVHTHTHTHTLIDKFCLIL